MDEKSKTIKKIEKLIEEYEKANIAWYTNQANVSKLNRVNRIQRKIEELTRTLDMTDVEKLWDKFLKAHWAINFVKPSL